MANTFQFQQRIVASAALAAACTACDADGWTMVMAVPYSYGMGNQSQTVEFYLLLFQKKV